MSYNAASESWNLPIIVSIVWPSEWHNWSPSLKTSRRHTKDANVTTISTFQFNPTSFFLSVFPCSWCSCCSCGFTCGFTYSSCGFTSSSSLGWLCFCTQWMQCWDFQIPCLNFRFSQWIHYLKKQKNELLSYLCPINIV